MINNRKNFRLAQDNQNLSELLSNKEITIISMNNEFVKKEDQYITKITDLQTKFDNVIISNSELVKRCEKYEREIEQLVKIIFYSEPKECIK
jgi:hypothetical protein